MSTLTHDREIARGTGAGWAFALASAASFGLSGPLGRGLMDAGWSAAAAVAVRVLLGGAVLVPVAVVQLRGRWTVLRAVPPADRSVRRGARGRLPAGVLHGGAADPGGGRAADRVHGAAGRRRVAVAAPPPAPTRLTAVGAAIGAVGLVLVVDPGAAGSDLVGAPGGAAAMVGAAFFFVLSSRPLDGCRAPRSPRAGCWSAGPPGARRGRRDRAAEATAAPVAYAGFTVAWWVPVLALGMVTAALGYGSGIAATRRLGARLTSFVMLSEVLATLVFAWLLLAEAPGPVQLLGGAGDRRGRRGRAPGRAGRVRWT